MCAPVTTLQSAREVNNSGTSACALRSCGEHTVVLGSAQIQTQDMAGDFFMRTSEDDGDHNVVLKGATAEENTAFWTLMLQFLCTPGKMGQYATPLAATNDPIFWVCSLA